jgi:hypothetical protein
VYKTRKPTGGAGPGPDNDDGSHKRGSSKKEKKGDKKKSRKNLR